MRYKLPDPTKSSIFTWHEVFCFLPRFVSENFVWLEKIERKRVEHFGGGYWVYRLKDKE